VAVSRAWFSERAEGDAVGLSYHLHRGYVRTAAAVTGGKPQGSEIYFVENNSTAKNSRSLHTALAAEAFLESFCLNLGLGVATLESPITRHGSRVRNCIPRHSRASTLLESLDDFLRNRMALRFRWLVRHTHRPDSFFKTLDCQSFTPEQLVLHGKAGRTPVCDPGFHTD
jgi:hypothetical protein